MKDIKIAEEQKENKQPEPNVPNDPAILVCWTDPYSPACCLPMMKYTGC